MGAIISKVLFSVRTKFAKVKNRNMNNNVRNNNLKFRNKTNNNPYIATYRNKSHPYGDHYEHHLGGNGNAFSYRQRYLK